jgi:hypothetical protein
MTIKILDAAKKDLLAAYQFYERQCDGLGSYFLDSLYSDIDSLMFYAGIHNRPFKTHFRLLSKRFPFAIYYKKARIKNGCYYKR